ncbi:MAG: hypothetical protein P8R42_21605 [Candidatus Binatia bacterium]|nr:hypothetical protein [Candidatus Binatia bacterium]
MNVFAIMGSSLVRLDLGLTGLEPLLALTATAVGVSIAILARDALVYSRPTTASVRARSAEDTRR